MKKKKIPHVSLKPFFENEDEEWSGEYRDVRCNLRLFVDRNDALRLAALLIEAARTDDSEVWVPGVLTLYAWDRKPTPFHEEAKGKDLMEEIRTAWDALPFLDETPRGR